MTKIKIKLDGADAKKALQKGLLKLSKPGVKVDKGNDDGIR